MQPEHYIGQRFHVMVRGKRKSMEARRCPFAGPEDGQRSVNEQRLVLWLRNLTGVLSDDQLLRSSSFPSADGVSQLRLM